MPPSLPPAPAAIYRRSREAARSAEIAAAAGALPRSRRSVSLARSLREAAILPPAEAHSLEPAPLPLPAATFCATPPASFIFAAPRPFQRAPGFLHRGQPRSISACPRIPSPLLLGGFFGRGAGVRRFFGFCFEPRAGTESP